MWPRLNVWITQPGNACRVDDRLEWVVYVADAHGGPFAWKGFDYGAGIPVGTPGHAEFELAPGTYVVWAERPPDEVTHKAVVVVAACDPIVCVQLLPRVKEPDRPDHPDEPDEPDEPHEPERCEIRIAGVRGEMSTEGGIPKSLEVTGTAVTCPEVVVTVEGPAGVDHCKATVDAAGDWSCTVDNGQVGAHCGRPVRVEAVCAEERDCRAEEKMTVECSPGAAP